MTEPDIYARSLYAAEDGDMNKLEQKLVVELTALPNVRWWHRNIARQGFSINGFIKHYCFENYPLYCPKCKQETLINANNLQITVIQKQEH